MEIEYSEDNLPSQSHKRPLATGITDKDICDAYEQHGSVRKAAEAIGMSFESVRRRLKRHEVKDPAVKDAMNAIGTKLTPRMVYYKTHKTGDPTYTVLLKPDENEDQEDINEKIVALVSSIDPIKPIPAPKTTDKDTITSYPIFDAHLGLRSLKESVGEDYNIALAERFIGEAMSRCVAGSPSSETAIIINGGDFTHADNNDNETPANHHKLDVEGLHEETIDAAIRLCVVCIETAARKHKKVIYRQLRGNHDPETAKVLTYSLRERYRLDDRITIDCSMGEFFVTEFGRTMIVGAHGDKAKWAQLAHFIPDAWPEMWGRTKWRYCLSGHLHREKTMDIGGVRFETCRAATKPDRYANSFAYCGKSQLRAITYHREHGESGRVVVNY